MSTVLVRHLFVRLLRRSRLIGIAALASVAGFVAWVAGSGTSEAEATETYMVITSSVPAATLSIAVLLMSTAVMRDERDGGTLPFIFISPISSLRFALSAWSSGAAAVTVVTLIGWGVGAIGLSLTNGDVAAAWPALALYLAAALAYSAVFVPLGYLFSRSLLIGLGYVFVWEGILASFVSGLSASSVWRIAMSIYADLEELPRDARDVLGSVEPGVGGGVITVLALIAVGVALLAWAVRARDAV